jgi:hypothetical protein
MRSKMKDQIETKVTKHGKFFTGIDENIYNPIPIICPECGSEDIYDPTKKDEIREEKHLFVYRKCFILLTKCECGCEFETKKYLRTTFDFGELFAYLFILSLLSLSVCSVMSDYYNYESSLLEILYILSLAILLVSIVGGLYCIAKEYR